jgi:predicted RNase H-like HicB family nuclease
MTVEAPPKLPRSLFRLIHAIRTAVRSALIDWQSVKRTRGGHKLTGHVTFTVTVDEDPLDGGFVAACRELPGCVSQGETEEEAVHNLAEAIIGVVEARMQRHLRTQPLHQPGDQPQVRYPHRHTLEIPVT